MTPVLEISGLRLGVRTPGGTRELVHGADLTLHAGQRAALVGESGSGKTITALSIMRLNAEPTFISGGSIMVRGTEITTCTERELERLRGAELAMIYQDPLSCLNPVRTIGNQLAEALRAHRTLTRAQARGRAAELLDEVGVANARERLDDYPHQFSGGMRQRVMIAIAISCEPALLIADEPTTALDVTTQARILELLDRLAAERGMAVLFITHDLAVASGFCDRIHVMRHGELVEHGEMCRVLAAPQHAYTRNLLDSVVTLTDEPVEAAPPEDDVLARVSHVSRVFDRNVRAVHDVSLEIRRGETFGLVGESGSGKSTLAKLILGLDRPTTGEVHVDGANLNTLSRPELRQRRRHMQIVLQDPVGSLNRRKTVRQIVGLPLAVHRKLPKARREERVRELLELVGLPAELAGRYPRQLSGGQCQRVNIARALALEPRFVVLDEAVSAVDVVIQAQILDLLAELQQRLGLTYLFVSHDLAVVRHMAPRIAVMHRGRIVEQGDREEIFTNPREEYTKTLLGAIPEMVVRQ